MNVRSSRPQWLLVRSLATPVFWLRLKTEVHVETTVNNNRPGTIRTKMENKSELKNE